MMSASPQGQGQWGPRPRKSQIKLFLLQNRSLQAFGSEARRSCPFSSFGPGSQTSPRPRDGAGHRCGGNKQNPSGLPRAKDTVTGTGKPPSQPAAVGSSHVGCHSMQPAPHWGPVFQWPSGQGSGAAEGRAAPRHDGFHQWPWLCRCHPCPGVTLASFLWAWLLRAPSC